MIGVVKYFNCDRGFGFIAPDDGSADVFAFVTNFNVDRHEVKKGMTVEFVTQPDQRSGRPEAVNIKIVH